MRFLKNKIARANALLASRANVSDSSSVSSNDHSISSPSPKNVKSSQGKLLDDQESPFSTIKGTYENTRQTKNISKNFG